MLNPPFADIVYISNLLHCIHSEVAMHRIILCSSNAVLNFQLQSEIHIFIVYSHTHTHTHTHAQSHTV